MTFRVGMKVVCIKAGVSSTHAPLCVGSVYHIRAIGDYGDPAGPWVKLREVKNVTCRAVLWDGRTVHEELVYSASRFRPVQERKTDISIFTAMLNPSQATVDAMNMADLAREIHG